jgi:hypothetical protein
MFVGCFEDFAGLVRARNGSRHERITWAVSEWGCATD